jgi:hypothetical protein
MDAEWVGQYAASNGPTVLRLLEEVEADLPHADAEAVRSLVSAGDPPAALERLCAALREGDVAVTVRLRYSLRFESRAMGLDEHLCAGLRARPDTLREHLGLWLLLGSSRRHLEGKWDLGQLWPNVRSAAEDANRLWDVPEAVREQVRQAWAEIRALRDASPRPDRAQEHEVIARLFRAV